MKRIIGFVILACLVIGVLIAIIKSIGWKETLIVLFLTGAIVAFIFFSVWLIWC